MKRHITFVVTILCCACVATAQKAGVAGPHLLIYKTKKSYQKLVPVTLTEDKSKIASYPDPHDLKAAGDKMAPVALHGGYLMNYNGIGINTAFLKMTYAKYAGLEKTPSPDELFKMIVDKNPLTTLYDCGLKSTYTDPEAQINQLIDKKMLPKKCKSLLKK